MRRWWVFLLALALMVLPAVPALAGGGIRVLVDGVEVQTDAAPFIHRDGTMVPVRALAEALGFAVDWDGAARRVTLARGETVLVLQIDSTRVLVGAKEVTLDVPALIRNNRTFVPLRFVAERLGATVVWDGAQRTVLVTRSSGGPAPGIDPEARAILDKVLAAGQEVRDEKAAGQMVVEVAASAGGVNMAFAMPAEMQIHTYQGDMLMTMAIKTPEIAGGEVIQAQAAARGGFLYGQDPETGEWELLGPYTPGEIPDVGAYPIVDLADVTELEAQILQRATVTVGGTETLDGVTTTRLDIRIAPEAFEDLFRDLLGSLGTAVTGEADITVDRYLLSLWVDPDGYVRKLTFDLRLRMVVRDPELPEPVTLVETGTGEFHFTPVSEPIDWPESLEVFLQSQE